MLRSLFMMSAVLLGGCAVMARPQREVVLRIDPASPLLAKAGASSRISLAPVSATGSASERRYAYVESSAPREVKSAATLFWEEPPPLMVQRAMERGLSARLGSPVLATQTAPVGQRRLTVELDRFEEETGATADALVDLDATVLDVPTRSLVLVGRYCARRAIGGSSPSDRSAAFEGALNLIMDQLARDIEAGSRGIQGGGC